MESRQQLIEDVTPLLRGCMTNEEAASLWGKRYQSTWNPELHSVFPEVLIGDTSMDDQIALRVLEKLIEHQVDVLRPYEMSIPGGAITFTVLHQAVQHGSVELVHLLLDAGADPYAPMTIPDSYGDPEVFNAFDMVEYRARETQGKVMGMLEDARPCYAPTDYTAAPSKAAGRASRASA